MEHDHRWEEVFKLVTETGDRVIVMRENGDPVVLMNLDSYRSLLMAAAEKGKVSHLSERELLDHINQQIAEWRESRKEMAQEYDIAAFGVDKPAPGPQPMSSPSPAPKPPLQESSRPQTSSQDRTLHISRPNTGVRPRVSLPIVEDDSLDDFKLEPLT